MKTTSLLIVTSLLLTFGSAFAGVETNTPTIMLDCKKVDVAQVLKIYQGTSGLMLVVDSRARVGTPITIQTSAPVTKDGALALIEHELVSQAGVVITRLDDKRASVTFNDHLTIQAVK